MIKRFLSYIEAKTKITSLFAFLMALSYLFYIKVPIKAGLTVLFFASMLLFDLTTTAINNYIDSKTNGQVLGFGRKTALIIIYVLFGISTALGLYLAYLTDIVVLVVGALCFMCGVLYTYGPVPFSRQPYGEILSGIFYGFFIPFLLLYINMPDEFLTYELSFETVELSLRVMPFVKLVLLSVVPVCTTANIMFANNICDVERDIRVKRYTLPYYLENKALYLFAGIYYFAYLDIVIMVMLRVLHPICLFVLLTLIPVHRNIVKFLKKQEKETTFIYAIYNYLWIMSSITVLIFLSGLIA